MLLRFIAAAVVLSMQLSAQQAEVEVDRNSSKKSHKVISITSDDGSGARTYRRVIKDGKVVEESGDRSLLKNLDVDISWGSPIERLKRLKDRNLKSSSAKRRIVIKDGKIIEETSEGELPEGLLEMITELKDGSVFIGGKPGKGGRWFGPDGLKKMGGSWRLGLDSPDFPEDIQEKIEEALEGIEGLEDFKFSPGKKRFGLKKGGKGVFRFFDRSKAGKGDSHPFPMGGPDWESMGLSEDIQEQIEKALGDIEGIEGFEFGPGMKSFELKGDGNGALRFFNRSKGNKDAKGRFFRSNSSRDANSSSDLKSSSDSDHSSESSSDLRKAKREMKRLQKRMRDLEKRLNKRGSDSDGSDRGDPSSGASPRFELLRRVSR